MKKYRVGRLEIHEYHVEVEAKDMVEALAKVQNGEGDPVDEEEGTYLETCEERGVSIDVLVHENPELNNKKTLGRLRDLANDEDFIPSIRSIEEI